MSKKLFAATLFFVSSFLFADTLSFQEGVNGYQGTQDTFIREFEANSNFGSLTQVNVDRFDPNGTGFAQGLLRFDDIFGAGANQIQLGSTISSATLTLQVTNARPLSSISMYQMLSDWSEDSSTWDSLIDGVQNDGTDSLSAPGATFSSSSLGIINIDITSTLQAWSNGDNNRGWVFIVDSSANDLWIFNSSENSSDRPLLNVNFTDPVAPVVPEASSLYLLLLGTLLLLFSRRK